MSGLQLEQRNHCWIGRFRAMASPCEIHIEHTSKGHCLELMQTAMAEALRIERVFSRYRDDNLVWSINNSRGKPVLVDEEMAGMLDFATQCHDFSEGLFDVTSGVLREAWQFDGSARLPDEQLVQSILPRVGWHQVHWSRPEFSMPAGMQLDFGGIAKEYAVDRCLNLLRALTDEAVLVNFGGDLHASKPPETSGAWRVGIEQVEFASELSTRLELHQGALTTSGDARRYLLKDGVRYGHVLNPKTGWPVMGAPCSVTVAGNSCIEAGILSTLAILNGEGAEQFLKEQGISFWVQWEGHESL